MKTVDTNITAASSSTTTGDNFPQKAKVLINTDAVDLNTTSHPQYASTMLVKADPTAMLSQNMTSTAASQKATVSMMDAPIPHEQLLAGRLNAVPAATAAVAAMTDKVCDRYCLILLYF